MNAMISGIIILSIWGIYCAVLIFLYNKLVNKLQSILHYQIDCRKLYSNWDEI